MRTGDAVFHRPTEETWLVAYVDEARGELVCCGWPCTFAKLSDCELREACTDEESEKLLQDLAAMNVDHDGHDARKSWARRVIRERGSPSEGKSDG